MGSDDLADRYVDRALPFLQLRADMARYISEKGCCHSHTMQRYNGMVLPWYRVETYVENALYICAEAPSFGTHPGSVSLPTIDKRCVCSILTLTRAIRPSVAFALLGHFCHYCKTRQGSILRS